MKLTHRIPIVFAVLLLMWTTGLAHAQQARTLDLKRTYAVGERYLRSADVDVTQRATFAQENRQTRSASKRSRARIVAEAKVLEVNEHGLPKAEVLVIREARYAAGDGAFVEAIAPGRIILARQVGGETIYRPQTGKLSPEAQAALQLALRYPDDGAAPLSAQLSPGRAVAPGASWSADREAMAQSFRAAGMQLSPDQMRAQVRYVENLTQDDRPCFKLQVDGNAQGFSFDNGMPVSDTAMSFELEFILPDQADARYGDQTVNSRLTFTTRQDAGLSIETRIDREEQVSTRPLD